MAVLTLDNLSDDEPLDWMRLGVADMLITDLSRSGDLDVWSTHLMYNALKTRGLLERQTLDWNIVREMADLLTDRGVDVQYAIHPVAGRMPGHMNVLLAEANVSYDLLKDMDEINPSFPETDVVLVVGANDVINPLARTDQSSPIFGMPILDVDRAKTVLFVKRSLAAGYAGVENELFFRDNTMMLFGDAKEMCENIVKAID